MQLIILTLLIARRCKEREETRRNSDYPTVGQVNHGVCIGETNALWFIARIVNDRFNIQITVSCHLSNQFSAFFCNSFQTFSSRSWCSAIKAGITRISRIVSP